LLDPTGFLDASALANDETSQFLGSDFVNNPTIEFPDYTLGGAYHHEAVGSVPGYTLLLTSSYGLADNSNRSYSALLDLDATSKGVFVAGEIYWELSAATPRLGLWSRTDEHAKLNGEADTQDNYGIYTTADFSLGRAQCNLRLGLADEAVSEAANFIALALEYPLAGRPLGIALGRTGTSSELEDGRDGYHAEVYVRFELNDSMHLTPSVQYIENRGPADDSESHTHQTLLVGLRATYGF